MRFWIAASAGLLLAASVAGAQTGSSGGGASGGTGGPRGGGATGGVTGTPSTGTGVGAGGAADAPNTPTITRPAPGIGTGDSMRGLVDPAGRGNEDRAGRVRPDADLNPPGTAPENTFRDERQQPQAFPSGGSAKGRRAAGGRPGGGTPRGNEQGQDMKGSACLDTWDASTHISRERWSEICTRVDRRDEVLKEKR
jgi:hypothetical protein